MSTNDRRIPSWRDLQAEADPAEDVLTALTETLAALDGAADEAGVWPEALWDTMTRAGVCAWSSEGLDRVRLVTRYARIGEGSLTAAFILSQHDAAVRRLVAAGEHAVARDWLDAIKSGAAFTTVGISHLTTSRRAGAHSLKAVPNEGGFRLDGVMPWVTGAQRADVFVAGAGLEDGRQLLLALPADRPGVRVQPAFALAALQASCTAEVQCEGVSIDARDILAGPALDVIAQPGSAGTGGLETSALALGQARAALVALEAETPRRQELNEPVEAIVALWLDAWTGLQNAARGNADAPAPGQVRSQANAVALRATQAYLTARKGSGFLRSDPAQRWARQALFFLVWSCPSPVANATIRELAGICDL